MSFEYSYESCLIECRIKEINRLCNCTPFYYPRLQDFRTCMPPDFECLSENKHIFYSVQPPPHTLGFSNQTYGIQCRCFPNCNNREYKIHSTVRSSNSTSFMVYFQDYFCLQYRRDVYMTWDALFGKSKTFAQIFFHGGQPSSYRIP